jgi:hypothetical protein
MIKIIYSWPVNYWDKFVKKKVREKYSETYDFDSISSLLGMEVIINLFNLNFLKYFFNFKRKLHSEATNKRAKVEDWLTLSLTSIGDIKFGR